MDALSLIAVTAGAVVAALALHVWYALGLSRVFVAHGSEPWRAWVPLLNDAEVFRLGRIDPVRAVLLLVPVVNVYGLVLKGTAAHRLGAGQGRGAGTTALAVVLPPVWAAVLARTPGSAGAAVERSAPEPVAVDTAPDATPAAAPISAVPGTPVEPAPPAAAAGGRRAAPEASEPVAIPVLPGPREVAQVGDEDGESEASREGAAPGAATAMPATAMPSAVAVSPTPSAAASAPMDAAPVARAAEAGTPATPAASADAGAFERVAETTDATAERSEGGTAGAPAAALDESTQTARPRSRRRGEWALELPDGTSTALTSRTVVLGRKPSNADEATQYIAVVDGTRTMSKEHARLDWTVTGWSVTDLDSTNGVTLVHDDGSTERVPAGGTAVVPTRFRLGDAALQLRPTAV
ncbi:FHA domain-containing protein [Microbacterium sp.]|uniref:FHA domain-containing protein n=1 Tax=Microbacterium sp. TaxID=51671 RepID=UPI00391C2706